MTIPEMATRLYDRFGSWSKAARALNISDTALYAWRDGRTIPGFNFVEAIAAAIGASREEIRDTLIAAHELRDTRRGPQMTLSPPRKVGGQKARLFHREARYAHA